MYPSLTLSKGFSTKGMFRNIGIDMKKMNKQSTKGNSNDEKKAELCCQHLFHPCVPASSKLLPEIVAKLNSPLKSCKKIIRTTRLYYHACVCDTHSVYLSLCHILFHDRQDREPAHASIPGDVEDHKDVRDQSWSTKIYLISKSNSNSHKFVS